jgi:hypothetical protein
MDDQAISSEGSLAALATLTPIPTPSPGASQEHSAFMATAWQPESVCWIATSYVQFVSANPAQQWTVEAYHTQGDLVHSYVSSYTSAAGAAVAGSITAVSTDEVWVQLNEGTAGPLQQLVRIVFQPGSVTSSQLFVQNLNQSSTYSLIGPDGY